MKAVARADQLLAEHSIKGPPVDVEAIARRLGVTVTYEDLEPSVSGMLVRPAHGDPVIVVNDRHAPVRQRFTVAHEIAHLDLHKGRPVIVDHLTRARVNLRDETSSMATDREEIAANQFAASLLMPADWVHDEVEQRMGMPTGRLISELASQFFVSEQAMEYRLMNLGLRAAP